MSELASVPPRRKGAGRWFGYIGLVLLGLAMAALLYELWVAWQSGGYRMISAGELWFSVHGPSLNLSQALVQRYIHPTLWDPGIISLLQWPAWSIFGALGAFLTILFAPWFRTRS